MKIKIICIGKIKNNSLEYSMIQEYQKRLKNSVEIIELEIKNFANENDKKQKEAEVIQKHISSDDYIIAMDEHGDNLTSMEFAKLMKEKEVNKNIIFIIGGAFGIDKTLLDAANKKIAFGKVTYPHKLLRVMLVEQIYRAKSINSNHPYHKQ